MAIIKELPPTHESFEEQIRGIRAFPFCDQIGSDHGRWSATSVTRDHCPLYEKMFPSITDEWLEKCPIRLIFISTESFLRYHTNPSLATLIQFPYVFAHFLLLLLKSICVEIEFSAAWHDDHLVLWPLCTLIDRSPGQLLIGCTQSKLVDHLVVDELQPPVQSSRRVVRCIVDDQNQDAERRKSGRSRSKKLITTVELQFEVGN